MNILVNGIGNIGKTLLGILCDYKKELKITKIYALKNGKIHEWNKQDIDILIEKGVVVCSKHDANYKPLNSIINSVNYIFDCNANTLGLKNKDWYHSLPNLKGCSAQGSEKGFGLPFMSGINNEVIKNKKFVQIVSCNTHALSCLITTLTNNNPSNLIEGDFVVVRRSEDIGNHERLVTANVVSRHLDEQIGTHHAIDVKDLFKTKNINLNIQSSDITTPSQLMHSVRFDLCLKKMISKQEIDQLIASKQFVSSTSKFDSNVIFEAGRRYSPYGRLFSHAIINNNNILFDFMNNRIKGWAFIPQEGNTIISTIHAFLLQTNLDSTGEIIDNLIKKTIRNAW